jgi:prophage maintenance system killer protein
VSEIRYPSIEELIELNKDILQKVTVKRANHHEVLSRRKLEEIVDKVRNQEGDVYDKAVTLLSAIITSHPFASGVRRTAYVATKAFLLENGEVMDVFYEPSVFTGIRERFYTRDEIKAWLEGNKIRKFARV